MSYINSINVASIKVVEPELKVTLQNASRHFEAFMGDRSIVEPLQESRNSLVEIVGILKLLAIPGALPLASEMLRLLEKIMEQPAKTTDFMLSALSHGFVALPCYIEYVADTQKAAPMLTLDFVNELKAGLREPLSLESDVAGYIAPASVSLAVAGKSRDTELPALVSRLRQMYQIGLVGLIREVNLELKMQLMHRALSRLSQAVGDAGVRTQWILGEAVLEAMLCNDLSLSFTRKRTLSLIDGELRKFEDAPDSREIQAPASLIRELVYLVNLSGCTHTASLEVSQRLSLTPLEVTDRDLQREQSVMQGPNAETIVTMVKALREELAQSREILEIAAQQDGSADLNVLVSLFHRTADILSVVGLKSPGQMLKTMSQTVKSWTEGTNYSRDSLLDVADGLLYVESALSNLSRLDLNFQAQQGDTESKHRLMARSQLDEAQGIVIKEAQAGIAQAKKDINSFIESSFDMAHIGHVIENLVSVRGGLAILSLKKAAAVLTSCIRFVESIQQQGVNEEKAQSILETMADALIALEYYLSEIELHGDAHPRVLAVAEQSLAALGFPVAE